MTFVEAEDRMLRMHAEQLGLKADDDIGDVARRIVAKHDYEDAKRTLKLLDDVLGLTPFPLPKT